jgi:hypothetical protein
VAIEEFNGGMWRGFIPILDGKKEMGLVWVC